MQLLQPLVLAQIRFGLKDLQFESCQTQIVVTLCQTHLGILEFGGGQHLAVEESPLAIKIALEFGDTQPAPFDSGALLLQLQ